MRTFLLIWVGQFASLLGSEMTNFAITNGILATSYCKMFALSRQEVISFLTMGYRL
ncbi:MAG: hypothetical protein AAFX95_25855 [Cyanobacteria bacterium J06639_16]